MKLMIETYQIKEKTYNENMMKYHYQNNMNMNNNYNNNKNNNNPIIKNR